MSGGPPGGGRETSWGRDIAEGPGVPLRGWEVAEGPRGREGCCARDNPTTTTPTPKSPGLGVPPQL